MTDDHGRRRLERKHPLAIRLTHWVNVPVLAVMVWSGVAISGRKEPRRIAIGNWTIVELFPESFHQQIQVPGLAAAMGWHFLFAAVFVANGLIYLISVIASGSWRSLIPNLRSFHEARLVLWRDLGLRESPPAAALQWCAADRVLRRHHDCRRSRGFGIGDLQADPTSMAGISFRRIPSRAFVAFLVDVRDRCVCVHTSPSGGPRGLEHVSRHDHWRRNRRRLGARL